MIQDVEDQRLSNNRCLQAETTSGLTSKPQGGTKETSDGPLKPIKTIPPPFFTRLCYECLSGVFDELSVQVLFHSYFYNYLGVPDKY